MIAVACGGTDGGGSGAGAKDALIDSLKRLGETEAITTTFTLESTPESLQALAGDGGDMLDSDDASLILASTMSVSSVQADNPSENASEVVLDIDGVDALDVRVIGEDFYARSDVRGVAQAVGADTASLDQVAAQGTVQGFSFLEPAIAGKWLALEGFSELTKSFTGTTTVPGLQQQKAAENFVDSLSKSTKVTDEGTDEAGSHLVATLTLRDVYEDYSDLLQQLPTGTGAGQGELPQVNEVPRDGEIIIDTWVNDGILTQLEVDFLQFADEADEPTPEGVEELALRVTMEELDGTITEPPAPIQVDVRQVLGALGVTG